MLVEDHKYADLISCCLKSRRALSECGRIALDSDKMWTAKSKRSFTRDKVAKIRLNKRVDDFTGTLRLERFFMEFSKVVLCKVQFSKIK